MYSAGIFFKIGTVQNSEQGDAYGLQRKIVGWRFDEMGFTIEEVTGQESRDWAEIGQK